MTKIIKEEIEIDDSLVSRLNVICDFCNTTPIIKNSNIRKIEHTNLTYIEPHRIIINNKLYLAFNYSNETYVHWIYVKFLDTFFKQPIFIVFKFIPI